MFCQETRLFISIVNQERYSKNKYYIKLLRKLACANITVSIRRRIIRIKIERTSVITVIPLTAKFEYV